MTDIPLRVVLFLLVGAAAAGAPYLWDMVPKDERTHILLMAILFTMWFWWLRKKS
jgi:hypothetical protein